MDGSAGVNMQVTNKNLIKAELLLERLSKNQQQR